MGGDQGPGRSQVGEKGADVGRASWALEGRGKREKSGWLEAGAAAEGNRGERGLTANGVERGPRPLLEALSEPQAVLLAIQQRVHGPVHGPARVSRPDRHSSDAAATRASRANVQGKDAPGTAIRRAPRAQPAPTRGRKQSLFSAPGWGRSARKQGRGTSGVGEGPLVSWRKWRGRCHGKGSRRELASRCVCRHAAASPLGFRGRGRAEG